MLAACPCTLSASSAAAARQELKPRSACDAQVMWAPYRVLRIKRDAYRAAAEATNLGPHHMVRYRVCVVMKQLLLCSFCVVASACQAVLPQMQDADRVHATSGARLLASNSAAAGCLDLATALWGCTTASLTVLACREAGCSANSPIAAGTPRARS